MKKPNISQRQIGLRALRRQSKNRRIPRYDLKAIQKLTACISKVQSEFILSLERHNTYETLLSEILALTKSQYGFIGEVLTDALDAPYLKTFAITNVAWDSTSAAFYAKHAATGLEFRNLNTLFGYTLLHNALLLTNQPATHPLSGGVPPGHPPLVSYLGIPINYDGQLVAMLGLANKPGGFSTQDIRFLQPLISTIGQLVYASRIKQQQEQVQQQLHNIVVAAEVGTWRLDLTTSLLAVNARWLQMLGYQPDELELLNLDWLRANMHPDDLPQSQKSLQQHLCGETDYYESEFRIKHKSGHWVWVQSRGRMLLQERADPVSTQVYGINIDISQEKRLQQKLTKLAEHVPGMVYQFQRNADGSIVFPYVGPAVEKLLGFSATQLAKDGAVVFAKVHSEDVELLRQTITVSAQQLSVWQHKFRLAVDGVHYRWLAGQSSPELQDSGAVLWHGYIQDVTDETELQFALQAAKEQAERAVATKASFLANMSHEIRTPMNGVIGMLDILAEANQDPNQIESINLMRDSAYSLMTIIDDILDFSKLEAGKLNISKVPCQLTGVIEQLCSMLDFLALKSHVELTYFIDPAIQGTLWLDPNRLRQILVNLLSNAIKFSSHIAHPGEVHLAVTLADQQQTDVAEALLQFSISDNGIGMAPEVVSKLFQPFTQADDSTSRKYGGTGLGLAITQQLVQLMNGVVSAQSVLGKGSIFTVMLPVEYETVARFAPELTLRGVKVILLGEKQQRDFANYAVYLQAAGADVVWCHPARLSMRLPDLALEKAVWLFDSKLSQITSSSLVEHINQAGSDLGRYVILGRGRRRKPRRVSDDTVYIDANILQAKQLCAAVSAAYFDTTPAESQSVTESTASVTPQQYRILVLEDNTTNQKVIRQQLQRLGYQVDVADDGFIGLSYTQQQHFDLILTDLHMPNMDGYQFTRAFRSAELSKGQHRVPVIALTANIVPEELARCKEEGMDDYLVKPLPVAQLKATLQRWLLPLTCEQRASEQLKSTAAQTDTPEAEEGLFNTTLLAETVGAEFVGEVLVDYIDSLGQAVSRIEHALNLQQWQDIVHETHKLKSSSRFVGATRLGDLFAAIEQELKQTIPVVNVETVAKQIATLTLRASEVIAAIRGLASM